MRPSQKNVKKSLRIIGGTLRGKRLQSVKGKHVRPSANRLRESIFNILSPFVSGSVILDLFAGTGALGIEALSRGAESAVFIDGHIPSVLTVKANIEACDFSDLATVIRWDIVRNLKCLYHIKPLFDLVFMDPPYHRHAVGPTLLNLAKCGSLKHDSLVIIEHSMHELMPSECSDFHLLDQRKYGKTLVSFLRYMV